MTRWLISSLLLLSGSALAQSAVPVPAPVPVPVFDLERLTLNPGGASSLVMGTGDGLTSGRLRVSLTGQYQHNPLLYSVRGTVVGAVVGSRFSAHLAAGYGVTDWLELGLQLPIVLVQTGSDLTAQGLGPVSTSAIGSPLLQAQLTLLRQDRGAPLDLGVGAALQFPLGSAGGLSRDPGVAVIPRIGVGRTFGALVRVGVEGGAIVRQSGTLSSYSQNVTDEVGSLITLGAVASTVGTGLRGELNVRSLIPLTRTAAAVELLAGVRYPLLDGALEVYAVAGPGFGRMPGVPAFRVLGGIAWRPSFGATAHTQAPNTNN